MNNLPVDLNSHHLTQYLVVSSTSSNLFFKLDASESELRLDPGRDNE
jgi:hypothetical protein